MTNRRLEPESGGVRRLLAVTLGFVLALLGLALTVGPAAAGNVAGPQPVFSILTVGPHGVAGQESVGVRGPPPHQTVSATGVAAETAPQVLKGAIPDAIPKNLPRQLALNTAKDGQGTQIMANLGDAPRLNAVYGNGDWVRMQYVLRGADSNGNVHYFRNLTTGLDVEFKFK